MEPSPVNTIGMQIHAEAFDTADGNDETPQWLTIEQQKKLFLSCPLFFRAVRYPKAYPSTLALLGMQFGLGWYPIIETAALEIEAELRTMWCEQAHSLWNIASLDHSLLMDVSDVYPVIPFCADIRVVEGELRFSMLEGYLCDEDVWLRILKSVQTAVHKARVVCERCGKPGELRETYWHHVYCDECTAPLHFVR